MSVLCARVQQLLRGAFVPSDFCAAIQGISLFRVPLLGTVDCTRVFPGRISGGLLVALRMFMCLRPRFSCGTCGAKCSCLPDFSSTFLQVPLTNWWHDFYLPTTYCVISTSQSYICCYPACPFKKIYPCFSCGTFNRTCSSFVGESPE